MPNSWHPQYAQMLKGIKQAVERPCILVLPYILKSPAQWDEKPASGLQFRALAAANPCPERLTERGS